MPLPVNPAYQALPVLPVREAIVLCNSFFAELSLSVEGEVANLSISRGKFVFFDLKDEQEEVRLSCFMMLFHLNVPLEDGMRIIIEARPGIFAKSGQFRLTVHRVTPIGEGSVKRAFELLKGKLEKEGLFAPERKRMLPRFVQRIGIISSADAAGYGDFMKILQSRLTGLELIFANVAVQGRDAEAELCQAVDYLNSHYSLDALVLVRGGGSMEDLHAFNSEAVARAICRSKAPVVVGVGHERDVTIADFCADLRAATPSNAAQLLVPTKEEVKQTVYQLLSEGKRQALQRIQLQRQQTTFRLERLRHSLQERIQERRSYVQALIRRIEAISPEHTLKRGYTLTTTAQGYSLSSLIQAEKEAVIITRFYDGQLTSLTQPAHE